MARVSEMREPLYQRIFASLQKAIETGRIPAGGVLYEEPIADLFDASRAPVRRALAMLHESGLLRRIDGRGHVVGAPGIPPMRVILSPDLFALDQSKSPGRAPNWAGIYDQVERVLIHQAAVGPARVNELALARHFNVGRSIAHAALMRLEAVGVVRRDARLRWQIVPLDAERVAQLYQLRILLESVALREAALHIPADVLLAMRKRLIETLARYPDVEATDLDALETDLHIRCLGYCPNAELIAALERTRCLLVLSKHVLGVVTGMPTVEPFLAEHISVFDALLGGRADAAEAKLRQHLENSSHKVIGRLSEVRELPPQPAPAFIN